MSEQLRGAVAQLRAVIGRWLVPFLRVTAEGGWLAVLYAGAVVGIERRAPVLGPFDLAVFVGAGAAVTVYLRRQPELGAILLIGGVFAAGAVGWLADPDVRSLLVSQPLAAFEVHGPGWLAALAVLRGSFVPGTARNAHHFENLLHYGLPGLALLWAAAAFLAPPALWVSFGIPAVGGTVMFLVAGMIGLGLSRIEALREAIGSEGLVRRWRLVVTALGIAVVPIAIPFVLLIGIPAEAVVGPIVGLIEALLILTVYPISFIVWLVVGGVQQLVGGFAEREVGPEIFIRPPVSIVADPNYSMAITILGSIILAIVTIFLAVLVYVLAHWLLSRREQPSFDDDADAPGRLERAIMVPEVLPRPDGVRARRAHGRPFDAAGAYVAALAELESRAPYARVADETPALHAARVTAAGMPGSSDLARLAADYQLARYAARRLTPAEDRRAHGRLARLRRLLQAWG